MGPNSKDFDNNSFALLILFEWYAKTPAFKKRIGLSGYFKKAFLYSSQDLRQSMFSSILIFNSNANSSFFC